MRDPLILHAAYKRLFDCADGETVLRDIENRGFLHTSPFVPDSDRTLFNLGRQSLVQHILHMREPGNFKSFKEDAADA